MSGFIKVEGLVNLKCDEQGLADYVGSKITIVAFSVTWTGIGSVTPIIVSFKNRST